jgi:putative membrane-bound dehydrogenase-like protein
MDSGPHSLRPANCNRNTARLVALLMLTGAQLLADIAVAQTTKRLTFDPAPIQLDPRLEMTLWAAEPDVVDPVAIAWDAAGRAFVAECRDYPYGVGENGVVGSTIRLLVDTDGDGRADRSTVFSRDLGYATSVTPWRDGIIVIAAPEIIYLRDTDGDGAADAREVLFSGLTRGVSDSLANGLRYGLDNRIHAANGGNGGTLRSAKRPETTYPLDDDDFAFFPDTGEAEPTGRTGGGFGLVFDDFGRAFTTYNIDHLQHRFLSRRHAERFPGFPPVPLTASISDHGEMSRIFPISTAVTRPNHPEQAGHFSAAGGMGRVASALFPDELRGSVFVCDVVGNLVHRDVLLPDGPVFRASRADDEQSREFLASRDGSFRPVGLETGPDGALYLLDMQRDVIEHPDYIPAKLREKQDIRAGQDRGRVYRIAPKNSGKPLWTKPSRFGESALISALGDDNQWVRLTAQRLLVERRSPTAVAPLRKLAAESPRALGRLHALWTLHGLGQLRSEEIIRALSDTHPGNRENALWLAEVPSATNRALASAVLARTMDSQPRVRFAAALATGAINHPSVVEALVGLWRRDHGHIWTRRAILSSLRPDFGIAFTRQLLTNPALAENGSRAATEGLRELADLLGARAGGRQGDVSELIELAGNLHASSQSSLVSAIWEGLAAGIERGGSKPVVAESASRRLEAGFAQATRAELRALWLLTRALGLPENIHQTEALVLARAGAANVSLPAAERVADIRLLGLGSAPEPTEALLALLDAREPVEIQQAALVELRRSRGPDLGSKLVARWRTHGPELRGSVLNLLLERRAFHEALVSALESGTLAMGELNLDLEQRRRLLRGGTAEIRKRAGKFMGDEEYSNRKSIVDEWLAKLPAHGDVERGRKVFSDSCAQCHVSGGLGHRVGPDLSGVAHRSVEDLLSNILDPNMAINPGFVAYTVETDDGEAQTGLLKAQTADAIVLRLAGNQEVTLPRKSVTRLEASSRSLMPEGLESGRTPQELRDLISYVQAAR